MKLNEKFIQLLLLQVQTRYNATLFMFLIKDKRYFLMLNALVTPGWRGMGEESVGRSAILSLRSGKGVQWVNNERKNEAESGWKLTRFA